MRFLLSFYYVFILMKVVKKDQLDGFIVELIPGSQIISDQRIKFLQSEMCPLTRALNDPALISLHNANVFPR